MTENTDDIVAESHHPSVVMPERRKELRPEQLTESWLPGGELAEQHGTYEEGGLADEVEEHIDEIL